MQTIVLRKAGVQDAARITEIYNSNPLFLQHHLGRCRVDEFFVRNEMEEMERARFSSFLFVDLPEGDIVGLADVKAGEGVLCYALLEQELRRDGAHRVRIDVVCEYPENAKGFWSKQGFSPAGTTRLLWGGKESEAVVMHKQLD